MQVGAVGDEDVPARTHGDGTRFAERLPVGFVWVKLAQKPSAVQLGVVLTVSSAPLLVPPAFVAEILK